MNDDLPTAMDYSAMLSMAVTKEWCRGWDDARAAVLADREARAAQEADDFVSIDNDGDATFDATGRKGELVSLSVSKDGKVAWACSGKDCGTGLVPAGVHAALLATPPAQEATVTQQPALVEHWPAMGRGHGKTHAERKAERIAAQPVGPEEDPASATLAKRLIGWRTDDYLYETSDLKKAKNWEQHYKMLPIFEGDPHTKLVATAPATAAQQTPGAN